jgi:hypothetical protein
MPRKRDYKKEYSRRKARAAQRGLSLSVARGHPRAGETGLKAARLDQRLESALKGMRAGATLKDAAVEAKVSRERLSAYAKTQAGAARSGRVWTFNDRRRRQVQIIRDGEVTEIWVEGYEPARTAGQYMDEAARLIGDPSRLAAFQDRWAYRAIRDAKGRLVTFPTDPNELYRAIQTNDRPFEQIYKLVMV